MPRKREEKRNIKINEYKEYIKNNFPEDIEEKTLIRIFDTIVNDYHNIIYVKDMPFLFGNITGLFNKETNKPVIGSKRNLSYMKYICPKCNKEFTFKTYLLYQKNKKISEQKIHLCQKCKTKENTQSDSFKEKQRIATKKRWENGEFQHLIDSGYMKKWGRKYCTNILFKSEEEKKEISRKKIETWLKRPEEERKEINKKRAKGVKSLDKYRNIKAKFILEPRFCEKEWENIKTEIFTKAKQKCSMCKKTFPKKYLSVHHMIPYRMINKNENLICLCKSCHSRVERYVEKLIANDELTLKKELTFIESKIINKKEEFDKEKYEIINETTKLYYIKEKSKNDLCWDKVYYKTAKEDKLFRYSSS